MKRAMAEGARVQNRAEESERIIICNSYKYFSLCTVSSTAMTVYSPYHISDICTLIHKLNLIF
jgi:hypothetical protein